MKDCAEAVIGKVLDAALHVHSTLGPGLLEAVYQRALMIELAYLGVNARSEVQIPITYRGRDIGIGYRADILVDDNLLLELKSVEAINPLHISQIISYLRLLRIKRGYIVNFNVRLLKHGIRRISI